MDIFFTIAALALPVLLGGLWLNLFVPLHTAGRTALIWGNGSIIGLLLIPQLMRVLDALGVSLSFVSTGSLASVLIVLAIVVHIYRGVRTDIVYNPTQNIVALPTSHRILFVVLLLLIAVRVLTLGLEILWRPLFPWDATMHWATKARVWFEFNSIVPFVENHVWLQSGGEGVFTDRHAHYPGTVPLLQVWMNLATGRWDESLMNLPWLLCFIALGAAFYGQLRVSTAGPATAMAFTYLLLSMPMININVALAGYADLFLGAAYCAALMAFHNWSVTKQHWQAILAVLFALACPLIKNEGIFWSLTLIPAFAVALMARREAAKLLLLLLLILIFLILVLPQDLLIAGHTLGQIDLYFRVDALLGTVKSIWLHDSWHLMGYLLIMIVPLGLIMPGAILRTYLGITIALAGATGLFLFLFLFTGFGWGAANFTAVGRLSVQLVPGLVFLAALIFNEIRIRGGIRSSGRVTPVSG